MSNARPLTDRFSLEGKTAIVTGASTGLGISFAQGLAEAGADIALAARRGGLLEQTREKIEATGRRAIAVPTDVTDPVACKHLAEATVARLGRLDILVNNAGIGTVIPALRETPDQFRAVVDVNLNGAYWMAQAAAAQMEPGSVIVNIASILGIRSFGLPQAAYTSTKAALIALTQDLAQQWTGRRGIRVNALAPGLFESEMTEQYLKDRLEVELPRIPLGRIGDPAELAATVVFLASDAASYVTGATLVVDGGRTLV